MDGEDLRRHVWADDTNLEAMDLYMEFNHKTKYKHREVECKQFLFVCFYKRGSAFVFRYLRGGIKITEKGKSGDFFSA